VNLPSARGFSCSTCGVGRALASRCSCLLLRVILLRGLFGPHFFQFAHVFGFHAHKNDTTGPSKASASCGTMRTGLSYHVNGASQSELRFPQLSFSATIGDHWGSSYGPAMARISPLVGVDQERAVHLRSALFSAFVIKNKAPYAGAFGFDLKLKIKRHLCRARFLDLFLRS
jgi:hypothetical protein